MSAATNNNNNNNKTSSGKSKKHKQQDIDRIRQLSSDDLDAEYRRKGEEAWEEGWGILMNEGGWKSENNSQDLNTCIISSKHIKHVGKVFKLEVLNSFNPTGWHKEENNSGLVESSPQRTFEETVLKLSESIQWNHSLVTVKTLRVVDDCTDISYNATSSAAGGLVSSRDFINLRHWGSRDGILMSAGCAVQYPDMPPTKQHVRGENKAGGWVFKPVPGNPNHCVFNWIISIDLKGWVPQYLVDQAMTGMLTDFIKALREHMKTVEQQSN